MTRSPTYSAVQPAGRSIAQTSAQRALDHPPPELWRPNPGNGLTRVAGACCGNSAHHRKRGTHCGCGWSTRRIEMRSSGARAIGREPRHTLEGTEARFAARKLLATANARGAQGPLPGFRGDDLVLLHGGGARSTLFRMREEVTPRTRVMWQVRVEAAEGIGT